MSAIRPEETRVCECAVCLWLSLQCPHQRGGRPRAAGWVQLCEARLAWACTAGCFRSTVRLLRLQSGCHSMGSLCPTSAFFSQGSRCPIPAGLLESGCTDFLRVGPLRRISRRLLGQVGQRRRQLRFVWISAGHAFRWQPLMTMTCLHLADRSPCPLHDALRPAVPARQ